MRINNHKNNKGLTLVELLIALSLASLVVTVLFSFFMVGMRAYGNGNIQSDLQYEVRRSTNKIIDEIRHARNISSTSGSNLINIGNLINSDYSNYMKYSITDNILTITVQASKNSLSYELETEVLLDNNTSGDIAENSSGKIYFESPVPGNFVKSNNIFQSSDATLSSITPEEGSLNSTFDSSIRNYTVVLPVGSFGTRNITIFTSDPNADPNPDSPFADDVLGDLTERTASVTVTSEDGLYTKEYNVVFNVSSVADPITSIEFSTSTHTMIKNTLIELMDYLTVLPSDLINPQIDFIIVSGNNASIVGTTFIAGNSETVIVEASTTDGSNLIAELIIEVVNN